MKATRNELRRYLLRDFHVGFCIANNPLSVAIKLALFDRLNSGKKP